MSDLGYLVSGDPQAKITWQGHATTGGRSVYGSRRSIAHLEATNQAAVEAHGSGLSVIQSAYNTGVAASAGTHDLDAVYDVSLPGVGWWDAQRLFREQGWAAWYRYPPTFGNHIHMVSLGYTTRVGIYVPGQVSDYYAHRNGLSGHAADSSWHPADIDSTIFDYPAWVRDQEDDMPYLDWPDADKAALADDVAQRILGADLTPRNDENDTTVRGALNRIANRPSPPA